MSMKIIKEETDPICTRISLGGSEETGYYCVYRGERDDVEKILAIAIDAFKFGQNEQG